MRKVVARNITFALTKYIKGHMSPRLKRILMDARRILISPLLSILLDDHNPKYSQYPLTAILWNGGLFFLNDDL